ncbi:Lactate 2-monooxygenase [Baekduia alba]|uniref:lactate 2-monooxygenase n=1 Tax=Baekduia alba TaxID=2997333 RepID=UPI002341762F|nr:lactate 2-monooxygenase [Baekduia alba]WCB94434.1 Lactate 2-monooxygenase [Baekduia alba]
MSDDATPVPFGNYQYEIYLQGLAGQTPDLPVAWDALERAAAAKLDEGARGYVFGGAGSEDTQRENVEALARWRIVPRMLRDVSTRDVRTTVFATTMPAPVLLSPVGVQSIIHPEGELAVARAAGELGVPMVASTASSHTLEDIAQAGGAGAPRWFQLYWPKDDDLTASFVGRAEAAGYEAIVVTLDTPLLAWRPRDLQGAYLPFLKSVGIANYLADPVFRAALAKPPEEDPQAAVGHFVGQFSNPAATWDGIDRIRSLTRLPIVLKGINHPDDAREARARGVDGVLVSNHGGRQVDGAQAAIDALPGVVEAVGDDLTVLFDSGIRSGADVLKAIALGADATLVGRPYLWGLALAGADGVKTVLRSLLAELDLTLALSGHRALDTVGPEILARRSD